VCLFIADLETYKRGVGFDVLIINRVSDLRDLLSTRLGVSDWCTVSQQDIDTFANLTGDTSWIHTDPERASRTQFGSTIAHGLLTLSLAGGFTRELITFAGFDHALNYGFRSVRFPAPVPVNSRVRMLAELIGLEQHEKGAIYVIRQTFEGEGVEKPVCVAEKLGLLAGGED
jgi:acyl dehydratase